MRASGSGLDECGNSGNAGCAFVLAQPISNVSQTGSANKFIQDEVFERIEFETCPVSWMSNVFRHGSLLASSPRFRFL